MRKCRSHSAGTHRSTHRVAIFLSSFVAFAIVFLAGSPLRGQSDTSGALMGTVTDAKSSAVPGVRVQISNGATGYVQSATTAADGRFAFPTLAPGGYVVKFSAGGFKGAQTAAVVVNVSEDAIVDVRLEAGDGAQLQPCQCTITHSALSSTGTLVDSKTITATPLTTRNFTQVLGN